MLSCIHRKSLAWQENQQLKLDGLTQSFKDDGGYEPKGADVLMLLM